jgi:hypothetical protein
MALWIASCKKEPVNQRDDRTIVFQESEGFLKIFENPGFFGLLFNKKKK